MPLFIYEAIPIITNDDGIESEDDDSKIEYTIEAVDEEAAKKSGNALLHEEHKSIWSGSYTHRASEKK